MYLILINQWFLNNLSANNNNHGDKEINKLCKVFVFRLKKKKVAVGYYYKNAPYITFKGIYQKLLFKVT